jgi:hypothetical protein
MNAPFLRAIPAYEAERNRQAQPTKAERLIARANAAVTSLRHGAETGHCDAAKAIRLADTIQRQMNAAHDAHLWPDNVEGTDLWDTLAQWGEWIGMFRRATAREVV